MPDDAGGSGTVFILCDDNWWTASLLRSRGWTCGRYHTADLPGIWSHPGRCFSITSSIVTTIYGEDFGICTQTRRVPGMSNDLGRLDDLNQLSRYICEYRPKPEEIQKGLEKIRDKQGYSFKTQILIYAVISGSFSVFSEEMSTIWSLLRWLVSPWSCLRLL